ncbi:MAG: polysaccharide deacetylase family protein [Firmicutes bacterium]|nr:polysaccharide deacetylase family protein [Bacillota bacterium]
MMDWFRRGLLTGLALLLGLLGLWSSPRPARAALSPEDRYSLRQVLTSEKVAALTFDISWGTRMPPKVLAILREHRTPATFFLSGPWAQQNPSLVREMARDGFEIESHGWAHVNYSQLSYQGVVDNIARANAVLSELAGQRPRFVRPPNGDFSPQSIRAARSLGYTTVTWGTDSLDWMNPGVATIVRRVVDRVFPGDIILMHASDTCKQTDLALPQILSGLAHKGYRLVTLKQLMTYGKPDYRG